MDRYVALTQRLMGDTDVTDAVGDRIFPIIAPENTRPPYVVMVTMGAIPVQTKDRPVERISYTMDVNVYAKSGDRTRDIGRAIRRSLDNYYDLAQGIHVVRYEGESDGFEPGVELFYLIMQFSVPLENQ